MNCRRVAQAVVLMGALVYLTAAQNSRPTDILGKQRCSSSLLVRKSCARLKFRRLDGVCNNLCNVEQGSANTPFARLLPSAYDDRVDSPRQEGLPNVRDVSRALFVESSDSDSDLTHMTMSWGQFLAHDITLAGQPEELDCGRASDKCPNRPECIGIDILGADDSAFVDRGVRCIPLRRSSGTPNPTRQNPREQINILTAYIDASHIYGVSKAELQELRDTNSNLGLLRVRNVPVNSSMLSLLPPTTPDRFCLSTEPEENPCFLAGDFLRNNENQGLMAMHTLFVREHNRIALGLHYENPKWSSNRLLLEARKIMGAIMQHITYKEWLPALFPSQRLRRANGVELETEGLFQGYNPKVDASIINSMVTAAMRMGHSLVRNEFTRRRAKNRRVLPSIPTKDFYNPVSLYDASFDGVDGILQGLVSDGARKIDGNFVKAITENLMPEPDVLGDLPAINVQRARDHGLPPYNSFRQLFRNKRASKIADFTDIPPSVRVLLAHLYEYKVDNVDLFVGAMNEKPRKPRSISRLGRTFTGILLEGFKRLRLGDRFWYERCEMNTGFTPKQLTEIRKISLARIICDNTDDIEIIQPRVFITETKRRNRRTDCSRLPFINLREWKEPEGSASQNVRII